ncbi:hypothetical protein WJX84_011164 [Apatococcus fuscideae]|uniref:Uncharacterized protein n=1 Tax=Apatococcus fuscideae TaxID=2026836 RepID=A0AAW1STH4_9CHLO
MMPCTGPTRQQPAALKVHLALRNTCRLFSTVYGNPGLCSPELSRHIVQARAQVEAPARSGSPSLNVEDLLRDTRDAKPWTGLQRANAAWQQLCLQPAYPTTHPRKVVTEHKAQAPQSPSLQTADIVVLGGTLGIFAAAALQLQGKNVVVIERGQVKGRDQEWNISRAEMQVFVELGLLSDADLEKVLVTEFNPVRMGFEGSTEIITHDVLNCGVLPSCMVALVKHKFLQAGGKIIEGASFERADVYEDCAIISLVEKAGQSQGAGGAGGAGAQLQTVHAAAANEQEQRQIRCEVVVDALGSFSPISAQSRKGRKPDSVVLLVGTCAQGLPKTSSADLLWSFTPINKDRGLQYFWEAFPARDGLTTYMFAFADAAPGRCSLQEMFQDYLDLLPEYRGVPHLDAMQMQRAFFGFVPNWHDSPIRPAASRILPIGDAAGNRSALSFAGFGSLARHLKRLTHGLSAAMAAGRLSPNDMYALQPYSPVISLTGAMQFTMGTRSGQDLENVRGTIINEYLGSSFGQLKEMGEHAYRPFMEDRLQWGTLSRLIAWQLLHAPGSIIQMTLFMKSPKAGSMFASNILALGMYTFLLRLSKLMAPSHEFLLQNSPGLLYRWHCWEAAFKYGSAQD